MTEIVNPNNFSTSVSIKNISNKLTEKEKLGIINKLAEKCKQYIFFNAHKQAEKVIESIFSENNKPEFNNEILIQFDFKTNTSELLDFLEQIRNNEQYNTQYQ